MTALRTAMHDFIDILHQGTASRADLAMGFVTYTVTTNVGGILRNRGVTIQTRDGFTNVSNYTGGSDDAAYNPLGWRGCVENDQTVRDVSASATVLKPVPLTSTRPFRGKWATWRSPLSLSTAYNHKVSHGRRRDVRKERRMGNGCAATRPLSGGSQEQCHE
jgi:hypothetical protein